MTREPLDDDAIGRLVRDTAARWTMPPVRLDAPGWRERVRSPRVRRVAAAHGWLRRIGQAATAAVALAVVGALVGVLLTRPPARSGASPVPSGGSSPGATSGPAWSPLPKLLLHGALPRPAVVIVQTELGDFARVDLGQGAITPSASGGGASSAVHVAADGTVACLCVAESGQVGGSPTNAAVTYERFDAAGARVASLPIETFTGAPDPRDAPGGNPDMPAHVLVKGTFSADGRYGFVGWSLRAHPVWRSGIVVVDLRDGSIVSRLELPDATTGVDTTRRVVDAPRVIGVAGEGDLLIARSWYESTVSTQFGDRITFDNDVYRAGFAGGALAGATALPGGSNCGDDVMQGGALAGDGAWLACGSGGASFTLIRRLASDGTVTSDTRVTLAHAVEGEMVAASPDGQRVFVWDPVGASISAVDLETGAITTGQGPVAAGLTSPLAAVGEWLTPSAAAKSLLRGGVVVSPDGTRVYAVGVTSPDAQGLAGSSGVYAFDAGTLASVGHWNATADFVSLAVSRDGAFVYAAGLPGADATGDAQASQGASITVFSAVDGQARLIAGELGFGMLTFVSPVLD